MRKTLLAIPLFAATALFAASHAETTTYVDGNLTGIEPNSGATLSISDDNQLSLRTGLTNVAVPFEKISHAELGAVKENPHDASFIKFWAHHKPKNETQLLIVNFKNDRGEDKTMTLELARTAAASVYESIQGHGTSSASTAVASNSASKARMQTAKKEKPDMMKSGQESEAKWWGDDWWKTTRNADKWSKTAANNAPASTSAPAGSNAPDQHQQNQR